MRLYVPDALRERVAAFVASNGLDIEVVGDAPFDMQVTDTADVPQSEGNTLVAGGRITCAIAWQMAQRHGIALEKFGGLLELLDIRIRECCLGCFK